MRIVMRKLFTHALVALAALAALPVVGCGVEPLSLIGDQCDLNSECQAPLVCALGRCRRQCEVSRDCALGLRCIKIEMPDLGICQLPDETICDLDSDCPQELACFQRAGGCLIECRDDGDCVPGETCLMNKCTPPEVELCVYPSDCIYPMVCGAHQECRVECTASIDCEGREECVQHAACDGVDGAPSGPCMCRLPCTMGDGTCPDGTDCVACGDGLDCGTAAAYCERPNPDGMGSAP